MANGTDLTTQEFTLAGDNPAGFGILNPGLDGGSFSDGGGLTPDLTGVLGLGAELGLATNALGQFPGGNVLMASMPGAGIVGPLMRRMPPLVQMALAKIAQALQRRNISVQSAVQLARRVGIPGLVALGLTIAEIAGLLLWSHTHKRRRMNALNPHALSRSIRRLAGFERRAARVSAMLGRVCRTHRSKSRSRGRGCVVCHRNPCVC